jgi:hypothetical protein
MHKKSAVIEPAERETAHFSIEGSGMVAASFDKPVEVRKFPRGRVELVNINGALIGRAIFEPGWRWSTCVKKIAKTHSCMAPHFQYHVSGRLMVRMDDGTEKVFRPGDVSYLPPGHDGWVLGNEPAVVIDFQGMREYGRSQT